MKQILVITGLFLTIHSGAQELYSQTEPASNKPARSITFRVDNSIMNETGTTRTNYHLIPEIMLGVSKKIMISGNAFFSNRTNRLNGEGGSIYVKYRFLSKDQVQKHLRLALYGRAAYNNSDIHQEEISMNGHNTGIELGVVATRLSGKVALSSSLSWLNAENNGNNNKFSYGAVNSRAVNYSFSIVKLMLPAEYSGYRQTNINLMVEMLGQVNTGSGKYYLDIAPSVQFIFNSQSRIDIGYRKELKTSLLRTAPNGFFIRLEHILFNAL